KAGADRWLEVMETAHRRGLRTSVTMMYGLGETLADRIEHLFRVREVQARTGGFTAFICWPLQPEHTELEHLGKTDAVTYLRTQAIARIVLDNVPNIQASWVTMGPKIGQVALRFGANDFGSLMMEENVVSAAGTGLAASLPDLPVIGVPFAVGPLNGLDALLATAQVPGGVPVACVGIDNAKNAAHLAVRILKV